MGKNLQDIGDLIWKSIRDNRTPLTDALLRVLLIFFGSIILLWILQGLFAFLGRKSGRNEADENAIRFVFTMIRYVVLIIAILIILRSCIAELTYGEASTLREQILWLHKKTASVSDYFIKYLLALVVFIIFHAVQNGFFKLLKRHLDRKEVREGFTRLVLNLVKYILLTFFVVASAFQMFITDGDSLIALSIYVYICIVIAVPGKDIRSHLSKKDKALEVLITLMARLAGMIVLVAMIFGIYAGVQYFLRSGGEDITAYLTADEQTISATLNTSFEEKADQSRILSEQSRHTVRVMADEEMNLLYYDGKLTGINITGRKYQIYGVSINQPEISAVSHMTYKADGSMQEVPDSIAGSSVSHYYYNRSRNDCLVMTVNMHSNRVVSITYYKDFKMISETTTLTSE